MEKFMIPIKWKNWGVINIEAENLDKAVEEVNLNINEINIPDGEAVEGSHEIDFEELELLNPGYRLKPRDIIGAQTTEQEERRVKIGECLTQKEEEAWRGMGEYLGDHDEEG